jgi:hypothetical protein
MQRDSQPIHNIGFGLTSRDLRNQSGEKDNPSPNSGFIEQALHGHPALKTATAFIATGLAVLYSGSLFIQGWLKLGFKLSQAAAENRSSVFAGLERNLLKVRSTLDLLEGVARETAGTERLVFNLGTDVSQNLSTGYGDKSFRRSFGYARETSTEWGAKQEMQSKLVRAARKSLYEVPALMVANKVQDKITGHGKDEQNNRDKKWYSPTSIVTDLGKSFTRALTGYTLGYAIPGAAAGVAKSSSLNFFYETANNWDSIIQQSAAGMFRAKAAKMMVGSAKGLQALLQEVGHDAADLLGKTIDLSARSTGALAAGWIEQNREHGRNTVAQLYQNRRGLNPTTSDASSISSDIGRREKAKFLATSLFGRNNQTVGTKVTSEELLSLIPGAKSVMNSAQATKGKYRLVKDAQTILKDTSQLDNILLRGTERVTRDAVGVGSAELADLHLIYKDSLARTIQELQIKSNQPFERIADRLSAITNLRPKV